MRIKELNCPNCGAKIKKGQAECTYCGTKLDYEELESRSIASPPTPTLAENDVRSIVREEMASRDAPAPTLTELALSEATQEVAESAKIAAEIEAEKRDERKHRIASITVSAVSSLAAFVGGVLLLYVNIYLSIALFVFGILRTCKIFYTFMRASYNMTPAGYAYSGIICTLITIVGIYGGIELLLVANSFAYKLLSIIPFMLAGLSMGYFVLKTVFYIKRKKGK